MRGISTTISYNRRSRCLDNDIVHTVHTSRWWSSRTLLLAIAEWIWRWTWWSIETMWTLRLHMPWHARLPLLLLWRSQTRTALSISSHDALEQVRWSVADCWRRRLRGPGVWTLRRASSLLEFVSQTVDFFFVSAIHQLQDLAFLYGLRYLCFI